MKVYIDTKICTGMSIALLYMVLRKQTSVSRWMDIQMVVYPQMEYYFAIKNNELFICTQKPMNIKVVIEWKVATKKNTFT